MPNQNDNRLKPGKTTGFTNIGDIVRANRENRLGGAVQRGVQNVIGQGQQQLGQQKQEFQQQAQQNALGTQEHKQQAQQAIQTAGQNQPDQNTIDRFAEFRAGQYRGPTELGNKEQLIGQGQQIQGIANAASGPQGQRGLLQRFVAPQQQYTSGQQRLDSLLLGQTGGQALRGARQAANQFNQQLIGADVAARAQGQGLQQQAQQFGQQVKSDLTAAQQAQQQDLQSRQEQAQKQAEAARASLYALLSKPVKPETTGDGYTTMPVSGARPTITQEQYDLAKPILEKLAPGGIFSPEYYVNSPEELVGQLNAQLNPSIDQIATEQDKARATALSQLSGGPQDILTGQVGGYDPLSFLNRDRFSDIVNQSKKAYDEYDAYKQAQTAGTAAKDRALQDKIFLDSFIQQRLQYDPYTGQYNTGTGELGGGWVSPKEGEEFLTLNDDPRYGTSGWLLDKNTVDTLRGNYDNFAGNLTNIKNALQSQNLGTTPDADFKNYLRSLVESGATLQGGGADIDYSVNKLLGDIAPKIQEREALGASGPRLGLLEKLQSLIG